MLTRLDRYFLRSNVGLFGGLLALALSILLMERMIRIAGMLSGTDNVIVTASRLLSNLVPHYLELSLPGALLITVIISVNRFSRTGEITTLLASGNSLLRIARPYLFLGMVLSIFSILLSGYLQPLSRYNYRQIVFELQQSSVVSAFQELKFVQFKDQTIWSQSVDRRGRILGETFITETRENGTRRFIYGRQGQLTTDEDGGWSIALTDAMIGEVPAPGVNQNGSQLVTHTVDWALPRTEGIFRVRGKDQRELTFSELLTHAYENGEYQIDPLKADADLHDRLSRSALLLILPFIGVVLGLNLRRNPRSGGVVIGILLLLVVQKLFEFGMSRAEEGLIPAWMGFWPVIGFLALSALLSFYRANQGGTIWNGFRRSEPKDNDNVDGKDDGQQLA